MLSSIQAKRYRALAPGFNQTGPRRIRTGIETEARNQRHQHSSEHWIGYEPLSCATRGDLYQSDNTMITLIQISHGVRQAIKTLKMHPLLRR